MHETLCEAWISRKLHDHHILYLGKDPSDAIPLVTLSRISNFLPVGGFQVFSIYHQIRPHSVRNAIPVATDPVKYQISLISAEKLCWIIMQSKPVKNIRENLPENLLISTYQGKLT